MVEFIGSGGQIILIEYFSRLFHGAKLLVSRLETFSFKRLKLFETN